MLPYKRILAVVDMDANDTAVLRRAVQIARISQTEVTVLHVVDYNGGYEADQFPMVSSYQVKAAMVRAAQQRIALLLERHGAGQARIEVMVGRLDRAVPKLVAEWCSELVIIGGPEAKYGLNRITRVCGSAKNFDVLTVQPDRGSLTGRLRGLLTPLLSAG
jgi:nucleotide-binding universal stress UspA family protein